MPERERAQAEAAADLPEGSLRAGLQGARTRPAEAGLGYR